MNTGKPKSTRVVEWIVVIIVVAVLVSLMLPCPCGMPDKARQTQALASAKQIGIALRQFAEDHDGFYPAWTNPEAKAPPTIRELPNSNAVLSTLFPDYTEDESLFGIRVSKWNATGKPDGDTSPGKKLEAGENGWSYVAGLNDEAEKRWPLLATAFAQTAGNLGANGSPTYTNDESQKGGVWKGAKAIVLRCDGGGEIVHTYDSAGKDSISKTAAAPFHIGRDNNPAKNAFNHDPAAKWLTPDCAVLQPIPPPQ